MHHTSTTNPILFFAGLVLGIAITPVLKKKLDESQRWQDTKDKMKENYDRVVDEAADKYSKAKGISRNELTDLVDDLKMHWGRIKGAWRE